MALTDARVARQYEHNRVFAGRNWNNGEVVGARPSCVIHSAPLLMLPAAAPVLELVLRGAGGAFLHTSWLLSTFCHEVSGHARGIFRITPIISARFPASAHKGTSGPYDSGAFLLTAEWLRST